MDVAARGVLFFFPFSLLSLHFISISNFPFSFPILVLDILVVGCLSLMGMSETSTVLRDNLPFECALQSQYGTRYPKPRTLNLWARYHQDIRPHGRATTSGRTIPPCLLSLPPPPQFFYCTLYHTYALAAGKKLFAQKKNATTA